MKKQVIFLADCQSFYASVELALYADTISKIEDFIEKRMPSYVKEYATTKS